MEDKEDYAVIKDKIINLNKINRDDIEVFRFITHYHEPDFNILMNKYLVSISE